MSNKSSKKIAAACIGLLLVVSFQNCSEFTLDDKVLFEQGVLDSSLSLDAKYLSGLLSTSSLKVWSKPNDPTFMNNSLAGDQWSMIIAADRAVTGTLVKVNTSAGVEETSISVSGGKIIAIRTNSISSIYEEKITTDLPSGGDKMVIAAAFGGKASDMKLMVNGIVQTSAIVKTGNPADFSYLSKYVSTGVTSGQMYEYLVYAGDSLASQGKLSGQELNVMSRYIANNNMIGNVVMDPALLLPDGSTGDSAEFLAAKAVFDAKCISCHRSGGDSPNLVGLTQSKAVDNAWVIKGSPTTSKLYYRLKNSSGSQTPKNMPMGSDIAASDVQKVADWINSIK